MLPPEFHSAPVTSPTQLLKAGIALGSNLGDRLENLRLGRAAVLRIPGVTNADLVSRIYETDAVDSDLHAPAFYNAVMEVDYDSDAHALLEELLAIERHMGRASKRPRNAPRVIDLDLLYAGNLTLRNEEVVIPHPRLHLRRFVLAPLAEIRPELRLPGYEKTILEMLASLQDSSPVQLLDKEWAP